MGFDFNKITSGQVNPNRMLRRSSPMKPPSNFLTPPQEKPRPTAQGAPSLPGGTAQVQPTAPPQVQPTTPPQVQPTTGRSSLLQQPTARPTVQPATGTMAASQEESATNRAKVGSIRGAIDHVVDDIQPGGTVGGWIDEAQELGGNPVVEGVIMATQPWANVPAVATLVDAVANGTVVVGGPGWKELLNAIPPQYAAAVPAILDATEAGDTGRNVGIMQNIDYGSRPTAEPTPIDLSNPQGYTDDDLLGAQPEDIDRDPHSPETTDQRTKLDSSLKYGGYYTGPNGESIPMLPGADQRGLIQKADGTFMVPTNMPQFGTPAYDAWTKALESQGLKFYGPGDITPHEFDPTSNQWTDSATQGFDAAGGMFDSAAAAMQHFIDNPLDPNAYRLPDGTTITADQVDASALDRKAREDVLGATRQQHGQLSDFLTGVMGGSEDLFNQARETALYDMEERARTDRDATLRGQTEMGLGGSSLAGAAMGRFDRETQRQLQDFELQWEKLDSDRRMAAAGQFKDAIRNMSSAELEQQATQLEALKEAAHVRSQNADRKLSADEANQADATRRDIESYQNMLEAEKINREAPGQMANIAAGRGGLAADVGRFGQGQANQRFDYEQLLAGINEGQEDDQTRSYTETGMKMDLLNKPYEQQRDLIAATLSPSNKLAWEQMERSEQLAIIQMATEGGWTPEMMEAFMSGEYNP